MMRSVALVAAGLNTADALNATNFFHSFSLRKESSEHEHTHSHHEHHHSGHEHSHTSSHEVSAKSKSSFTDSVKNIFSASWNVPEDHSAGDPNFGFFSSKFQRRANPDIHICLFSDRLEAISVEEKFGEQNFRVLSEMRILAQI